MAKNRKRKRQVVTAQKPERVEPYSEFDLRYFLNSIWDCSGDMFFRPVPRIDTREQAKNGCSSIMCDLRGHSDRPGYHRAMSALLHLWKGGTLANN